MSSMSSPKNQTVRSVLFRNAPAAGRKQDQRVQRTRDRLGSALMELLHQRHFDEITVQDVLDHAGVSRGTFYSHYRDKNDLFLSDMDEFFERMATMLSRSADKSERVAPVRELFAHVKDMRPFYDALLKSGRLTDVSELGEEHFARAIVQRLAVITRASVIKPDQRSIIACACAGALFALLTWWIHHNFSLSPEDMDQLFHRFVWAGAGATENLWNERVTRRWMN